MQNTQRIVIQLRRRYLYGAGLCVVWAFAGGTIAQVMESTSYQIEFDSVNIAGGYAESSLYRLEDTTGEVSSGPSESASYQLRAGYQQMNETFLTVSSPAPVELLDPIGGITGGSATGTAIISVITDNSAGYTMTIEASTSPALQHISESASFADLAPGGFPAYLFTTPSGGSVFGYTVEGEDTHPDFLDDGVGACGVGGSTNTSLRCWDGLTTMPRLIALRTESNHPTGSDTTVLFQAAVDAGAMQLAGTYQGTTTVTVLAQ